jgi:GTP-binding protein
MTSLPCRAGFLRSVAESAGLPAGTRAEVALLGRSNVGKSSLLNALLGCTGLARTSKTPGRTRMLNYFVVEPASRRGAADWPAFFMVDLPGYGFARVPRAVAQQWGPVIESYLTSRRQLALCVLLVDPMAPLQATDLDLYRWLEHRGRRVELVATKCDRLSGNERVKALSGLEEAFGVAPAPFSAKTGMGRPELWSAVLAAVRGEAANAGPGGTEQ